MCVCVCVCGCSCNGRCRVITGQIHKFVIQSGAWQLIHTEFPEQFFPQVLIRATQRVRADELGCRQIRLHGYGHHIWNRSDTLWQRATITWQTELESHWLVSSLLFSSLLFSSLLFSSLLFSSLLSSPLLSSPLLSSPLLYTSNFMILDLVLPVNLQS